MEIETWKEFIKNSKEKYKKIGYISCPAFNNDPIFFNRQGFNHLLRKGSVLRDRELQKERILLIPIAIKILKYAKEYEKYRESNNTSSVAKFWMFQDFHEDRTVCVIVRQINNGNRSFFSVFVK